MMNKFWVKILLKHKTIVLNKHDLTKSGQYMKEMT